MYSLEMFFALLAMPVYIPLIFRDEISILQVQRLNNTLIVKTETLECEEEKNHEKNL